MRQLLVIQPDIAVQRGLQLLAGSEVVALQHFLDASVEALDHAVGLGRFRRGQAVLDVERLAEYVELVFPSRGAFAQAKQAIRELFSIIRQNRSDAHGASALKVAQEAASVRCRLCLEDANKHPTRRAVDGHEEVTPRGFIRHLRQILHVDMDVSRLIGLEAAVLGARRFGLQIAQISDAMPAQATIQTRARDVRVQELAHYGKQVIERDQKRLAQGHGDSLLGGRQGRLKSVRRVAAIFNAVAVTPLINGLFRRPVSLRQN